jgi:hypothetical protein
MMNTLRRPPTRRGSRHSGRTPTFYRRRNQAEPAVYCHELGKYVPPDIAECSQFTGIAAMSLYEMQRLARPLVT